MQNILYLDDWINLYNKKLNKIIVYKPYKDTLENGVIIDREKFIKSFNKMLEKNNLKRSLFQESISVIINGTYTKENKRMLKDILNDLNYNKICFISEKNCLNMSNQNIFINYNESFFIISYKENKKRIFESYKNNKINKEILLKCFNKRKNKVYIYGKNIKELLSNLKSNKNYYIYSDAENILLNILIFKNSKV